MQAGVVNIIAKLIVLYMRILRLYQYFLLIYNNMNKLCM